MHSSRPSSHSTTNPEYRQASIYFSISRHLLDLWRQIWPPIVILTGSGLRPPNSRALDRECEVLVVKAQTTWSNCDQLLPFFLAGERAR